MKNKIAKIIYVVLFILVSATPAVTMLFTGSDTIGNEEKKQLTDVDYMNFSDKFDSFFSTEFGFRKELVNVNNTLKYAIFKQSGEDSVIAGDDGWLFYESALHDYVGEDVIDTVTAQKIAKIIEIMSQYVNSQGKKFVFVSAPNKMEIYGENMPYYTVADENDGNYEKIFDALENTDAGYVDLKKTLTEEKKQSGINIYHKLDSHWNNYGAWIAYKNIMSYLGLEHTDYDNISYTVKKDFSGDLYRMLFPDGNEKDEQIYFNKESSFYYTTNFRGVDDLLIDTVNEDADKNVLVFRDSFGNALYSFFAEDFKNAEFSRAVPYDFTNIENVDVVVVELVERNLKNLLTILPLMEAPKAEIQVNSVESGNADVTVSEKGDMVLVSFSSDKIPYDCTEMYFMTDKDTYMAYPVAENGNGCLYLDAGAIDNLKDCRIIYESEGIYYSLEIS